MDALVRLGGIVVHESLLGFLSESDTANWCAIFACMAPYTRWRGVEFRLRIFGTA